MLPKKKIIGIRNSNIIIELNNEPIDLKKTKVINITIKPVLPEKIYQSIKVLKTISTENKKFFFLLLSR